MNHLFRTKSDARGAFIKRWIDYALGESATTITLSRKYTLQYTIYIWRTKGYKNNCLISFYYAKLLSLW